MSSQGKQAKAGAAPSNSGHFNHSAPACTHPVLDSEMRMLNLGGEDLQDHKVQHSKPYKSDYPFTIQEVPGIENSKVLKRMDTITLHIPVTGK